MKSVEDSFANYKNAPPPPLPFWVARKVTVSSVTNKEIAKYWRQKCVDEEDHLLAAIKAAARIRARNFTEDDYMRFEESLKKDKESWDKDDHVRNSNKKDNCNNNELRVGIKDWWTKSKYAYLNQPAIQSMVTTKRPTSTYIPNFCCYNLASVSSPIFGTF